MASVTGLKLGTCAVSQRCPATAARTIARENRVFIGASPLSFRMRSVATERNPLRWLMTETQNHGENPRDVREVYRMAMKPTLITRREVLELLGAGAAAAAFPSAAFAQAPTFPKGAIIRTLLKDYAPEELAGGATLFHEHMQLAPDFMPRFLAAAAAVRAANGLPPAPARGGGAGAARAGGPPPGPDIMRDVDLMAMEVANAKRDGNLACIVDGGHPDMGRDINFLRQVSMKSGLPIVAGGGFYTQPFYPKEISTMSEEQIVQALVKQADD